MSKPKSSKCSCISFLICSKKTPNNYEQKRPTIQRTNEVLPENKPKPLKGVSVRVNANGTGNESITQRNVRNRDQSEVPNRQLPSQRDNLRRPSDQFELPSENPQPQVQRAGAQRSNPPPRKKKKVSNVSLQTKYKLEDIECCDFLPLERDQRYQFKYYCPICLRYFNQMLQSKCCYNYLCHFCVDELLEREKTVETFVAGCPYNCEGKFELEDINPTQQAKRYSDSQFMSFYSNNLGKQTIQSGFNKGDQVLSPGLGGLSGHGGFKQHLFQNSAANGFGRSTVGGNHDDKENVNEINRAAMMHRSDAMQYVSSNPLQQIRLNVLREANSFLPRDAQIRAPPHYQSNNNLINVDDQQNLNMDYDIRVRSPQLNDSFFNQVEQQQQMNEHGGGLMNSISSNGNLIENLVNQFESSPDLNNRQRIENDDYVRDNGEDEEEQVRDDFENSLEREREREIQV